MRFFTANGSCFLAIEVEFAKRLCFAFRSLRFLLLRLVACVLCFSCLFARTSRAVEALNLLGSGRG